MPMSPFSSEKKAAVQYLIDHIPVETLGKIGESIKEEGPDWESSHHFDIGMDIRNLLREGDIYFGEMDLDSVWAGLIKKAVQKKCGTLKSIPPIGQVMNSCEGCKSYSIGITHRVCIPPPSNTIRGVLISRDPTSKFSGYDRESEDKKGNLRFNAPPLWLFNKIKAIVESGKNPVDKVQLDGLKNFLDYECYWTHVHKCPTKPQTNHENNQHERNDEIENFPSFNASTAKYCGDKWFESEFSRYDLKDKIVITLGRDVEKFFRQWSLHHNLENPNKIISLPHPSGRCRSWNKNSAQRDHITGEITRLFHLLDGDIQK
jgi:hypothetical protein